MKKNQTTRDLNFELLRIVAMAFIVLHHMIVHGVQLFKLSKGEPSIFPVDNLPVAGSLLFFNAFFCIGYSLGYWLTSGHFNWQLMAVGVGSIGVAIPFAVGSNQRVRKAVELYNQGITTRGYTGQILDFQLGITPGSVGLIMHF